MASCDNFKITVHGVSTHGSMPHLGKDAILATAAIQVLQTIPSRINDPFNSLVVSVGMFHGGTKENIIADEAELVGTVRTFNRKFRNGMPELIKKVVGPTVEGYVCTADFDYYFGPSPLINDNEKLVKTARRAAAEGMGGGQADPVKEDDRG